MIDATAHRIECGQSSPSVANGRALRDESQVSNGASELADESRSMDFSNTVPDSWATDWDVASSALIDDDSWSFIEQFLNMPAE